MLCRHQVLNKTGIKIDANLDQQGSADAIELVLPVIRGFKRLRFLMTDKVSVIKLPRSGCDLYLENFIQKEILNKIIS